MVSNVFIVQAEKISLSHFDLFLNGNDISRLSVPEKVRLMSIIRNRILYAHLEPLLEEPGYTVPENQEGLEAISKIMEHLGFTNNYYQFVLDVRGYFTEALFMDSSYAEVALNWDSIVEDFRIGNNEAKNKIETFTKNILRYFDFAAEITYSMLSPLSPPIDFQEFPIEFDHKDPVYDDIGRLLYAEAGAVLVKKDPSKCKYIINLHPDIIDCGFLNFLNTLAHEANHKISMQLGHAFLNGKIKREDLLGKDAEFWSALLENQGAIMPQLSVALYRRHPIEQIANIEGGNSAIIGAQVLIAQLDGASDHPAIDNCIRALEEVLSAMRGNSQPQTNTASSPTPLASSYNPRPR